MRFARRLLVLAALAALLAALFARQDASVREKTARDEALTLRLLTEQGVCTVTAAEYLPCVLAAEMPADFQPEALKAQAVAARSYVLARRGVHEQADVCTDSACCLAYCGRAELESVWAEEFAEKWAALCAACRDTDGQILTFDGEPAAAVFHASSAGATEDSAALWQTTPYLVSVSTPETAALVPDYVTTVRFACAVFARTLGLPDAGDPALWLGEPRLDASGRVESMTVQGEEFTGAALRAAFGLRSTAFGLCWDGEDFVFTVTGSGHGVGMSQYGAQTLALDGWSYRDILAHYYPGTELVTPA